MLEEGVGWICLDFSVFLSPFEELRLLSGLRTGLLI